MNKNELIDAIAKKSGVTKTDIDKVLKAYVDTVKSAVKKGDPVQLVGFGTFKQTKRAARVAKNPQTGEQMKVPACKSVKFQVGKSFKEFVNGK